MHIRFLHFSSSISLALSPPNTQDLASTNTGVSLHFTLLSILDLSKLWLIHSNTKNQKTTTCMSYLHEQASGREIPLNHKDLPEINLPAQLKKLKTSLKSLATTFQSHQEVCLRICHGQVR